MDRLRLGVNIDHVATLRNARGGEYPDPVAAALIALRAGADGVTAHLREDRRHIRDLDMARLKTIVPLPLNFEMAATEEMLAVALRIRPHAVCLVPEKRQELTTEGGLEVTGQLEKLKSYIARLRDTGIRVSLFINADNRQVEAAKACGTDIVEFHTGRYCEFNGAAQQRELQRIQEASVQAEKLGLECHAGHGLNYENVQSIAAIPQMRELNIGHFLIGAAVFVGLAEAIKTMRKFMDEARK